MLPGSKKLYATLLLALTASACNFVSKAPANNNLGSGGCREIKSLFRAAQGAPEGSGCDVVERYVIQAQHFSPDIPEGDPVAEFLPETVTVYGRNYVLPVSHLSFSTAGALRNDPDARDNEEAYDRSEYEVTFLGPNGRPLFRRGSERSLAEAFTAARQECRRRAQEIRP